MKLWKKGGLGGDAQDEAMNNKETAHSYSSLTKKIEITESSARGKGEVIEKIILSQVETFTVHKIQAQCPSVSNQMIKKIF